jgi:hypothetical protein
LHVKRGVFKPLSIPVDWKGSFTDHSMSAFANAVGTVGHVTPQTVIAWLSKRLMTCGDSASPERVAKRAKAFAEERIKLGMEERE